MYLYFVYFLISGFCSILYELVWLRLAMAQFGVTTPVVSTFLSLFMGGLGAGAWIAGRWLIRDGKKVLGLRLYGLTEMLIGCSALIVPFEFGVAHRLLQSLAQWSVSSIGYYVASGFLMAVCLVPWCALMGATIPLGMFSIRSEQRDGSARSFSFLYLSNIVGAVFGACIPLLLIEMRGFRFTLLCGALLNALVSSLALGISFVRRRRADLGNRGPVPGGTPLCQEQGVLLVLFMTGLTTMAMELIWIRLFTVYLGPLVYSFALILTAYLFGTFVGSSVYRDASAAKEHFREGGVVWLLIPIFGSLPLLFADPRLHFFSVLRPLVAIAPFAAAVGYVTPMLVDRWASGDPQRAGHAYAVNVLGCIVGPLIGGFILLPLVGEHMSLVVLILPWIAFAAPWKRFDRRSVRVAAYALIAACVGLLAMTKDYEILFSPRTVLRDSTATVTATGTGMRKQLLVNGTGMTMLQPTTKMMAHLTLASLVDRPRSALVVCFGMGTTYRSVLSWGIPGTAVELVPSVPKLFPFYHPDGDNVLASPLSHLVIDDGRRFLERSQQEYDAIIIDPPPPVWAAGSSLLYSKQFYLIAKRHLSYHGILQQWLPGIGETEQAAVARSLKESFPFVRVFPGLEGSGWHFLASMYPIPRRTAEELVSRIPEKAVTDMLEWGPQAAARAQLEMLVSKETTTAQLIARAPDTPAVTDDRPINEYFLLRTLRPRPALELPNATKRTD